MERRKEERRFMFQFFFLCPSHLINLSSSSSSSSSSSTILIKYFLDSILYHISYSLFFMISRIINPCRSSSVVRHTSQLILKSSLLTITNHNKHLLHFQQPLSGISKIITRHNTTSTSASLPNSIDKELLLQFTCNICNNRSSHNISKQAYDHGTVVVQCPSCKSRHLISDNLGFMEYNKNSI